MTSWADPGPNGNVAIGFNSPTMEQGLHNFDAGITCNTVPSTASASRHFDVTDGFDNFTAGISAFAAARPIANASWERSTKFPQVA